jgi:hypothetical protein
LRFGYELVVPARVFLLLSTPPPAWARQALGRRTVYSLLEDFTAFCSG